MALLREFFGDEAHALREAGGEYGAATGRPRRVGGFDVVASRYISVPLRAYGDILDGTLHRLLQVGDVVQRRLGQVLLLPALGYVAEAGEILGPRRVGGFDVVASRYGVMMQGATEIALTKLDVLSGMEKVPVCVAYEVDGERVEDFPTGTQLEYAFIMPMELSS